MQRFYVITYRSPGQHVFFLRGDGRYEIYLPYIGSDAIGKGWVYDAEYARLFRSYPVFDNKSISKYLDAQRIEVFEYKRPVLPTHVIRPTKRPSKQVGKDG